MYIQKHNSIHTNSVVLGINQFSDLTNLEFKEKYVNNSTITAFKHIYLLYHSHYSLKIQNRKGLILMKYKNI